MRRIIPEHFIKKAWPYLSVCALFLATSCGEYVLVSKEGSESLIEGQRLRYSSEDARAEQLLQQAYKSPDRHVKSEAAFQLAELAQKNNRPDESLRYLEAAYKDGYPGSPVRLAKAYMIANPPLRNYDKAEQILKTYQNESVDAALSLAELYIAKQQFDKALPPLKLAGEMYPHSESPARDAVQIARVYRKIPVVNHPQSTDKAKQWYATAMEKGENEDAPVELAQLLMHKAPRDSEPYNEGLALLQKSANQNNLGAMENLGKAYYDAGDNEKALHWFTKRLERGDADGSQAYHIAKVYQRSKTQPEMTETWYRRAIAKNNHEAKEAWDKYQAQEAIRQAKSEEKRLREEQRAQMNQLTAVTPEVEEGYALMLSKDSDKDQAYQYFKHLADSGKSLNAMLMVDGWKEKDKAIYQSTYSNVEPKNLSAAVAQNASNLGDGYQDHIARQWKVAANYGSGEAAFQLAQFYKDQRPELAEEWITKAAKLGSGKAMLHRAHEVAVNGESGETDQQVFSWYEKAAAAGEAEGQYQTGIMYAKGKGVAQNKQKASYWLTQAKNNGYHLPSDVSTIIE